MLGRELANLGDREVEVFITHIKPGEVEAVMADIARANGRHRVRALAGGQVMPVTARHSN